MNPTAPKAEPRAKPTHWLLVALALVGIAATALVVLVNRRAPASLSVVAAGQGGAPPTEGNAKSMATRPEAKLQSSAAQPMSQVFSEQFSALTNTTLPLSQRRKLAETLAQDGSEPALSLLKQAFAAGFENLRAVIAESLGQGTSPEGEQWLLVLLQDPSTLVARGAVRALSTQDTPEAAGALVRLLGEADADPELRLEAAASLGSLTQPGVVQALADAANSAEDPDLAPAALGALGERDFAETEAFFKAYVQTPGLSSELRVAAVEALAQAQGDPSALLLSLASDSDAEVRAAAAWALSATDANGNVGTQVLELLTKETDPDVRLRLYQALRNQEGFDPTAALALVQQENNPSARVAGLDMLATLLRDNPTASLQAYFNATGIAELKQTILTGQKYDDRQIAVIALQRAHTPEAMNVLNELAGEQIKVSSPPAPWKQ